MSFSTLSKTLCAAALLSIVQPIQAAENLILITVDGLRWQEVFHGADQALLGDEHFVKQPQQLKTEFWREQAPERRAALMPFVWQTIAKQGVLIGDRVQGSTMSVANDWHFSYPGYSEIFTGVADNSINSNEKVANPNVSFIEWLNNKPAYQHKLAAFGSWDVFPYIFNTERSHLYVNAGFMPASGYPLSSETSLLNQLQQEIPSPWHNVRLDSFTYRYAKDYLLTQKPRVLSISFGETDDFAHDGDYDQYLAAAHRTDRFIADLWQTVQSTPGYKDNTVLLITTDHGRGAHSDDWQHHASKKAVQTYMKDLHDFDQGIVGSENIWFAAIGQGIPAKGLVKTEHEIQQRQIAATALTLLGEQPAQFNPHIGAKIKEIF